PAAEGDSRGRRSAVRPAGSVVYRARLALKRPRGPTSGSDNSALQIGQIHLIQRRVALHVDAARLNRLATHGRAEDVEERVPAHHVLLLKAFQDGQVSERQTDLRAVRLQIKC